MEAERVNRFTLSVIRLTLSLVIQACRGTQIHD